MVELVRADTAMLVAADPEEVRQSIEIAKDAIENGSKLCHCNGVTCTRIRRHYEASTNIEKLRAFLACLRDVIDATDQDLYEITTGAVHGQHGREEETPTGSGSPGETSRQQDNSVYPG
jgi:hypothetical protein